MLIYCTQAAGLLLVLFLRRRERQARPPEDLTKEQISDTISSAASSAKCEWPIEEQIDPSEIEFCKRPDGSDWLLGSGNFGRVRDIPQTFYKAHNSRNGFRDGRASAHHMGLTQDWGNS